MRSPLHLLRVQSHHPSLSVLVPYLLLPLTPRPPANIFLLYSLLACCASMRALGLRPPSHFPAPVLPPLLDAAAFLPIPSTSPSLFPPILSIVLVRVFYPPPLPFPPIIFFYLFIPSSTLR
ncbi:hypothetical protein C8R44DRAFT_873799 [Mycena epipterygia]|nr:hypothetical protein C8R44DRAFT_873799 [Mycena epipterygia]